MKKRNLLRLCLCLAVALFELPLMAQGVVVYKKNGTLVKFPYEEIDSIVTYNVGEDVEDVPAGDEDNPVTPPESSSAKAVDLGLPSGLLWASCNVGANAPEEFGGYYAWGETEEKSYYDWSTYKWCNGSSSSLTKYCNNSSYGIVDNKTSLDLEDDVAHVKWGGNWRMPTKADLDELLAECIMTEAIVNGVKGQKITGPNGNSIFVPFAGYYIDDQLWQCGSFGVCRIRFNVATDVRYAYSLQLGVDSKNWTDGSRFAGFTVRPVTEISPWEDGDDVHIDSEE